MRHKLCKDRAFQKGPLWWSVGFGSKGQPPRLGLQLEQSVHLVTIESQLW